ncbi:hypothetical protein AB0K21_40395 [Streptosporangium sp. NPDC049248]|uniref:hypothetical protein n=1 Tax=Streptosporangium sp. NPDC049248 TaxID=3155651 RepID=UPI00341AB733
MTSAHKVPFDEARLRPMLLRWLPDTLEIRTQTHQVDGQHVVLIYIAPNPAGCAFFQADGQYGHGKDAKTVFRQGEVFFRDGTESRRMSQRGLEQVIAQRVKIEQTRWERDHAAEYRRLVQELKIGSAGQQVTRGPAAEFNLALEPEVLTAAAIELLRARDDIPLRLLLNSAPARARQLLRAGDTTELTQLVERLACLAATFLTIERQEWFDRTTATLTSIYDLPLEQVGIGHSYVSQQIAAFWLMMTEHVLGLGSLAVRGSNWPAVKTLAAHQVPIGGNSYRTWTRHTLTMAARAGSLETRQGTQAIRLSLLSLARDMVRRLGCLRPEVEAEDERILTGLTQFDFLVCLVGIDMGGGYHPNFARFDTQRTNPAAERLLRDPRMRQEIFQGDGPHLAKELHEIDLAAQNEGFSYDGWEGYTTPVQNFISAQLR